MGFVGFFAAKHYDYKLIKKSTKVSENQFMSDRCAGTLVGSLSFFTNHDQRSIATETKRNGSRKLQNRIYDQLWERNK